MTARLAANDEPPMAERRAAGAETTPQDISHEATKTTKEVCRSTDGSSALVGHGSAANDEPPAAE